MVPRNAGRDLLKINERDVGRENPKANTTDFFIVILTGEESIWLPRPFLFWSRTRAKGPQCCAHLDVDDSVRLVSRHLCANDFESKVICQPIIRPIGC